MHTRTWHQSDGESATRLRACCVLQELLCVLLCLHRLSSRRLLPVIGGVALRQKRSSMLMLRRHLMHCCCIIAFDTIGAGSAVGVREVSQTCEHKALYGEARAH